jgi:hypothetical protein
LGSQTTEPVKNGVIIEEECDETNQVTTEKAQQVLNTNRVISYESGRGAYVPEQDPDGVIIRRINKETRNAYEFTQSVEYPPSNRKDIERLRLSMVH